MNLNYQSIYEPPKAKSLNRLAAFVMDLIFFLVLTTGLIYIIFSLSNYSSNIEMLHQEQIKIGYLILNDKNEYVRISEQASNYYDVINAYISNQTIKDLEYSINKTVIYGPMYAMIISLLVFEFIIPLIFKNGQTIGKKCLNVAVLSKTNLKITPVQLFIKIIFGKIVITTIIPYFCIIYSFLLPNNSGIGTIIAILIYLFDLLLVCLSKNKTSISDAISSTYLVIANETIFFNNEKEMIDSLNQEKGIKNG